MRESGVKSNSSPMVMSTPNLPPSAIPTCKDEEMVVYVRSLTGDSVIVRGMGKTMIKEFFKLQIIKPIPFQQKIQENLDIQNYALKKKVLLKSHIHGFRLNSKYNGGKISIIVHGEKYTDENLLWEEVGIVNECVIHVVRSYTLLQHSFLNKYKRVKRKLTSRDIGTQTIFSESDTDIDDDDEYDVFTKSYNAQLQLTPKASKKITPRSCGIIIP